jgi:hypothetical protein
MRQRPGTTFLRDAVLGLAALGGVVLAPSVHAAEPVNGANTVSELVIIARRAPTVSELDVVAQAKSLPPQPEKGAHIPKVVSTYPRQNEVVRQGLLIMRVTFDQPMSCSGFFIAESKSPYSIEAPNPCSNTVQDFLLSLDHKTIRVACFVGPEKHLTFLLNPVSFVNSFPYERQLFMSLQGLPLDAYHMTFSTSAEPPIQTIPEALSADPETVLAEVYRPARKAQAAGSPP